MSRSEDNGRWNVVSSINYFAADGTIRQPGTFKKPVHGVPAEHARSKTIRDVRPIVEHFKLDTNGFQFVKLPAKERDVKNDEVIRNDYYLELSNVVKNV
jgi:hypothetical protein